MRGRCVALVVVSSMAAACRPPLSFECATATDCDDGVGGSCEAIGFCSYPDPSCPDKRRFGASAGDRARICVEASQGADGRRVEEPLGAPADAAPADAAAGEVVATVLPAADAYVRGGTSSAVNFGAAVTLEVKEEAPSYTRESYLRFDLAALPPGEIVSARLDLTVRLVNGPATHEVALVAIDDWSETALTYDTRPPSAAGLATLGVDPAAVGTVVSADVTAAAAAERAGDGLLSLRLHALTPSGDGLADNYTRYHARESASPPALVVTVRP